MIELGGDLLCVTVEPERGGVIASVRAVREGVELLFQAPWPPGPPYGEGTSEDVWTLAWRGGWNVLFPNAGAACRAAGGDHPFHGAASSAAWEVVARDPRSALLRWGDDAGLRIERGITVEGAALRVESEVRNSARRALPYLLVEHLILGADLLGAHSTVVLPPAALTPLSDDGPPLAVPVLEWPMARRGAQVEDWSARPQGPASRYGSIAAGCERHALLRATDRQIEVRISWSAGLPYVWFWEERGGYTQPPWSGRATCLGIEPATVSTGEGLAAAVARGEAPTLAPGSRARYRVTLAIAPSPRA